MNTSSSLDGTAIDKLSGAHPLAANHQAHRGQKIPFSRHLVVRQGRRK